MYTRFKKKKSVDRLVCADFHFKFIFYWWWCSEETETFKINFMFYKKRYEASVFKLHFKDLRWDQPIWRMNELFIGRWTGPWWKVDFFPHTFWLGRILLFFIEEELEVENENARVKSFLLTYRWFPNWNNFHLSLIGTPFLNDFCISSSKSTVEFRNVRQRAVEFCNVWRTKRCRIRQQ